MPKNKTVVTWGRPQSGGGSSSVKMALMGIVKLYLTYYAFAAVLEDMTVVTWGVKQSSGFM